jgi:NADH dehydrogenase
MRPTVVIIGAGFGGLHAAQKLMDKDVDVLVVDRQNFHLFTPLLYQVATSGLEPGEIAYPVRGILRGKANIRFMLGDVQQLDTDQKQLTIRTNGNTQQESYDFLIVAAGSETHYFGMEQHAFGLKTLSDAVTLRNHLLKCFEKAAWEKDSAKQDALTTLVVVGGGPTGLETAGALRELYSHVLKGEYNDGLPGRVILIEMMDHLLDPYPKRLQQAARRQLETMGVEVVLGDQVVETAHDYIRLNSGRVIPTYTLIWAAGVKASPVATMLNVPLGKAGRVPIKPTTEVIGLEDVYVVGDMAYLEDPKGQPYPMLIPVAKQQGLLVGRNILRRMAGQDQRDFHYHDRGIMATIGRSRAVAWIFYKVQLTGFLAWMAWLGLHFITLMGFRNRLNVFINWVWNYFTYDRSVRIILEPRHEDEEDAIPVTVRV